MNLASFLADEKAAEKLHELPENFYEKANTQISAMIREHATLSPDGVEAQLLAGAIRADQTALKSLVIRRVSKILKRAALDATRIDPGENASSLTEREATLYRAVREQIIAAYTDLGGRR